ncbi:hypothetical protein GSS87_02375 [Corynebacterium sp. 4HC-13]|uniref:Uncharacterized protein n=1 Tax=Corynebacterium anserum TaxID=2684406 RepID=A0A7G7YM47_9CORY|nr:hypothetical protein [Corynebacterium anserum]MBC2681253.1 hypothetical protein [Corynebacterium anserum]QNH95567.1 hypothetical protein GP473_01610 [Corynebacterium anserum]
MVVWNCQGLVIPPLSPTVLRRGTTAWRTERLRHAAPSAYGGAASSNYGMPPRVSTGCSVE